MEDADGDGKVLWVVKASCESVYWVQRQRGQANAHLLPSLHPCAQASAQSSSAHGEGIREVAGWQAKGQ